MIDDDGKEGCAERLLDGEAGCACEPLLCGPISHPVLVFGKPGSGICFIGSAGEGAAAGEDGLVAGGAGFVCACASPAVPSAANSATAYSVRFIESSYAGYMPPRHCRADSCSFQGE
jgi:hypothetical protein